MNDITNTALAALRGFCEHAESKHDEDLPPLETRPKEDDDLPALERARDEEAAVDLVRDVDDHFPDQKVLGANKAEKEQVIMWLQRFQHSLASQSASESGNVAVELNKHLALRVFVVGSHITAADVFLMVGLHSYMSGLDDKKRWDLCNVSRWFNFAQTRVKTALPSVNVVEDIPLPEALAKKQKARRTKVNASYHPHLPSGKDGKPSKQVQDLKSRQEKMIESFHNLLHSLSRYEEGHHPRVRIQKSDSARKENGAKRPKQKRQKPQPPAPEEKAENCGGPNDIEVYKKHQTDNTDNMETDLKGDDNENTQRMQSLCKQHGIKCAFRRCPPDYYDQSLEWRQKLLGAPSTKYLCKSLLVHNTKCIHTNCDDVTNSKYYLIISQYVEQFNAEKVMKFVRKINKYSVGKKKFNFRLVPEDISEQLTGFGHNGVTPLGMKTQLPMIMSDKILELGYLWLGGGETDVKWAVNVADFRNVFRPFVADIMN